MDDERLPNIHPGEILKWEFLEPYGITPYRLSKDIGVPQTRVAGIVGGRRGISADTALRLSRYFGTSAEFWLNLQVAYDLLDAEMTHPDSYGQIGRSVAVMAATSLAAGGATEDLGWPAGFFDATIGSFRSEPIERGDPAVFEEGS